MNLNYGMVILIFCIVLYLYLHILYNFKTSNDLEILNVAPNTPKIKFEEMCDTKQPNIFDFHTNLLNITTENLKEYPNRYVNIRNVVSTELTNQYFPLLVNDAVHLLEADKNSEYYCENNREFLEETNIIQLYHSNEEYIRPTGTHQSFYDILIGSLNTSTPLKYEITHRNYLTVVEGNAILYLFPPNSNKYIDTVIDYELFEFKTTETPQSMNAKPELLSINITLEPGKMVYIPPYWWYSIQFNTNTIICSFKYQTYINSIANSHHILIQKLQLHNIKNKMYNVYNPPSNNDDIQEVKDVKDIKDLKNKIE